MLATNQQAISEKNSQFWDELCGSQLAKVIGVTDSSKSSLKKFDDWYFDYYPYLNQQIPFDTLKGKHVLEIGLGYGTVSQRLSESCGKYAGLDIAAGPVHMVNTRLEQNGLSGQAVQGSILAPPFEPGTFDAIVAIGCLHHTGNLKLAIEQCHSLLKPGGQLIFMVYSAYSYRRWVSVPGTTVKYLLRELMGFRGVVGSSHERERMAYDSSADGDGAPHTDFVSIKSMRKLCAKFSKFSANFENISQETPFKKTEREKLLNTNWPRLFGLDLYATAIK